MISCQNFERDRYSVCPPVGTESIPNGSVDGIINHIQACQSHKGHGPAAQLWRKIPLRWTHDTAWPANKSTQIKSTAPQSDTNNNTDF